MDVILAAQRVDTEVTDMMKRINESDEEILDHLAPLLFLKLVELVHLRASCKGIADDRAGIWGDQGELCTKAETLFRRLCYHYDELTYVMSLGRVDLSRTLGNYEYK